MTINFDQINQTILAGYKSIVAEWIPGGRLEGDQYVVCSPFRDDKTAGSFKINTATGVFKDFADSTVSGADPINLYAMINNMSQGEAAKELSKKYGGYTPEPEQQKKKRILWRVITPVPQDAPEPPKNFSRKEQGKWYEHKISNYYPYKNEAGQLIGYTVRIDFQDGRKEYLPLTYCTDGNKKAWKYKSFDRPRPIYGLDLLFNNPDSQVLIVEGEKCAEFARERLDGVDIIPIAWIGGSKSINYINWKQLKGRKIIFWPDADSQRYKERHEKAGQIMPFIEQPGASAMIKIYNLIKDDITGARLVRPPHDWVNGKDIADLKTWDSEKILRFIAENIITFDSVSNKPSSKGNNFVPFQCLGYNSYQGNVTYYYLPKGTRKVTALPASSHTKMSLLSLAPVQYYEREYSKSNGADYVAAANDSMRECESIGMYDPTRIRGRGAWFDDGKTVLHLGDRLIVDGEIIDISDFKSKYIYEAEIPTEMSVNFMTESLTAKESAKLLDICKLLSWEYDISAALFAGWIMLAPVCGAVEWRPHIWLTGESSTGKSWTLENIVAPILGNSLISPMSNSTEAGVRQLLKNDAFPIKFDEVESEDRIASERVQRIIELARQSSSNKSGSIVKGSTSGKAISYCVRSCFLFSSINPKLIQQADESRIKVLSLIKRPDYEIENTFDNLQELVINTLTEEYCERLRARSIKLIPQIRENAKIFSKVVSKVLKSKRDGDQIGTLLAGAYNLKRDDIVDEEQAAKYVNSVNWGSEVAAVAKTDQVRCLEIILQQIVRNDLGNQTEAIGGLLRRAGRPPGDSLRTPDTAAQIEKERGEAVKALRKYGITVISSRNKEYFEIAFAENHSQLRRLLDNTPWHNGYKTILNRLDDAVIRTATFADGMKSRAIVIPFNNVFENLEDDFEISEVF